MKKISNLLIVFLVFGALLSNYQVQAQNADEFKILVDYLEANGNYINNDAPSLVNATEIKENLKNSKYLIIDIRKDTDFDKGHIKGAVNVKSEDLVKYFDKKIKPANFDKITLVCYSGQSAAYYSAVLRLMGHHNVFALNYGMSSWAKNFAQNIWIKNISSAYSNKLESTSNSKLPKGAAPMLATGKSDAKEILKTRGEFAIGTVYRDFITKAEDVFANPSNYYIINYLNEEMYNNGHIPSSIHYQPKKSLNMAEELTTIPTDKRIVVVCETGQTSAHVVAYLHMLGYNVGNLAYGANGFMNDVLVKKGAGWNGFTEKEINNFPAATKELSAPGCD